MSLLSRLLDPAGDDRERVARKYRSSADWRAWAIPLAIGVGALLVSLIGLVTDRYEFWFAYLVAWCFCLTITLGALFFVMFQHVAKAKWVTAVRRFPENLMSNFTLLAVLGLPILLFGLHDLYHWSHHELYDPADPHYDPILVGKSPYFFWPAHAGGFPAFFVLRYVVYFALWITVSRKLYRYSVRQDTDPSPENARLLRKTSAWGIPTVAVTTAFAAYDYLMSLDPHWFSTMFGVYVFAGGFLAAIAAMTMMALAYYRAGYLDGEMNREHFHDLGKYLFAFTVFWAYVAFSQYMLIWYGNLPEETVWFEHRLRHGWGSVSAALLVFHFILPFFLLIPRFTKRVPAALAIMCGWTLVMHWIDLWWLAKPNLYVATGLEAYEHAAFTWVDLTCLLGLVGLCLAATLWRAGRHAVAPYSDPYYAFSLRFENV